MLKRPHNIALSLVIAAFFAVGDFAPRAAAQGASRARQASAPPAAAEAIVTLNERFLNAFLEVMFARLNRPSFPLALARSDAEEDEPALFVAERDDFSGDTTKTLTRTPRAAQADNAHATNAGKGAAQCASRVVLEREVGGVKTAVKFENGRIVAPLAFTGSYSVMLLGCVSFSGWADTDIRLQFDRARQVLSARVDVTDIHLSGVPSLASGVIVNLVQSSIDRRINPVEILQASQLSARVPVEAAGGALRLLAKEVRPEVLPGALRLHISYEFAPAQ